jgi:DNA-binding response OmpR family regulator
MRLLVSESDLALGTFLERGLGEEHYAVDLSRDVKETKSFLQDREYDLAILDLNLPEAEGLAVLQHARLHHDRLPILIITNRTRGEDHVQVVDLGADDFVLKPFAFTEISARVRALLRRGGRNAEAILRVEDLELHRVEHSARRAGRAIDLTPKEFGLLEYLMRHAGHRVTRTEIIQNVWNLSFDTMTNIVDVYINYLRKKVDADSELKLIHTIRGVGYRLGTEVSAG